MVLNFIRKSLPPNVRAVIRKLKNFNDLSFNSWDREAIAKNYLKGEGIEVGALDIPLITPPAAKVRYVDRMSVSDLRKQHPELAERQMVEPDIIDNGERLDTIQDSSQDFVIANQFIEHCQNPLMTFNNMFRVLKKDGILYLSLPDKRFTFDANRPVTPIDHIFRDYEEGPEWSHRQHYEEWVDLVMPDKDVEELINIGYSIHFHVWTQAEIIELISALNRRLGLSFDLELFFKMGAECIIILRKLG